MDCLLVSTYSSDRRHRGGTPYPPWIPYEHFMGVNASWGLHTIYYHPKTELEHRMSTVDAGKEFDGPNSSNVRVGVDDEVFEVVVGLTL